MAKILFEGIDIRDIEVTPNGDVIKRKKKEETETPKLEFNDADFYLLENEIKLVKKLHRDRINFYEENIRYYETTPNRVKACKILEDLENDAVKQLYQMMEDILNKAK